MTIGTSLTTLSMTDDDPACCFGSGLDFFLRNPRKPSAVHNQQRLHTMRTIYIVYLDWVAIEVFRTKKVANAFLAYLLEQKGEDEMTVGDAVGKAQVKADFFLTR